MLPEQSDISWAPVRVFGEERPARWVILCDHATNTVPARLNNGSLGIEPDDMARHIAYDIGAAGVALRLAERLEAPAVMADFSRLIIDPNRGLDDPTLIRQLSDGSIIPANLGLSENEITDRIETYYQPYHDEVARICALRPDAVLVSIHSFTPRMQNGGTRPWHIGILHTDDARLSHPLITMLSRDENLVVGDNEPYSGYLAGDTIDQHATRKGRHNTLVEIRSDLIETDQGQADWAERLADILPKALKEALAQGD